MKKLCRVFTVSLMTSALIATPVFAEPTVGDLQNSKSVKESEVSSLESELSATLDKISSLEKELESKTGEVVETNEKLEQASYKERQQYDDMKLRIRYLYEQGEVSFLEALLSAENFSDLVSKAEYSQNLHSYDKKKLNEYIEIKDKVHQLKENLDTDIKAMQQKQTELDGEKTTLTETISTRQGELAQLDQSLQAALAAVTAQQAVAAEQGAADNQGGTGEAGGTGNTPPADDGEIPDSSPVIIPPSGGANGQAVADYACQFIGNRYVSGGSSLTNGTDCSGFTMSVYAAFGVSLPHYDAAQESYGREVSYAEAQPGDLFFYGGHVAIYIGGGTIVHASNSAPYPTGGIKTSNANYRAIKTIRRIFG